MHNHEPEGYECPFCSYASGKESERNKLADIVRDEGDVFAYVSPRWWKNNPGNVMVIPRKHYENVYDIPDDLLAKVQLLGKKVALAIRETYGCDGISFRQHNEPAGYQRVWHYHLHVFPRWENDNLYPLHEESRYVSAEERAPCAKLLSDYFKTHG